MDDHAAARPERAGVHDHALAAEGETVLVLRQSGAGDIDVDLVGRRIGEHRQRCAEVAEMRPHFFKPPRLPRQKPGVLERFLARAGAVIAGVKSEVLALEHIGIRGGVRRELRSVGLFIRRLHFRRAPGLQFFREGAIFGGERLRRIAAQAKIIAHENERGFGEFVVLAPQLDECAAHFAWPVLHRLLELLEMPDAHLLPRGDLLSLLDAQPFRIADGKLRGRGGEEWQEGEEDRAHGKGQA